MGKIRRSVLVRVVGLVLSLGFVSAPATEAGILRSAVGVCANLLQGVVTRGREGLTMVQLSRHGLGRKELAQKFYGPQLETLLRLIEHESPSAFFSLRWQSTRTPEQLKLRLQSLGVKVHSLHLDDDKAGEGIAVVDTPLYLALGRLLKFSEIKKIEFVLNGPSQTVFSNLFSIAPEVLDKLSSRLLKHVLAQDFERFETKPLPYEIAVEFNVAKLDLWNTVGAANAQALRMKMDPAGKGGVVFLRTTIRSLLQILDHPEFTHAFFTQTPLR